MPRILCPAAPLEIGHFHGCLHLLRHTIKIRKSNTATQTDQSFYAAVIWFRCFFGGSGVGEMYFSWLFNFNWNLCARPVKGLPRQCWAGHVLAKSVANCWKILVYMHIWGRARPSWFMGRTFVIYVPRTWIRSPAGKIACKTFCCCGPPFYCNAVCSCVKFEIVVNNYPNGWLAPSPRADWPNPGYSCDQQLICEPASSPFAIKLKPLIF